MKSSGPNCISPFNQTVKDVKDPFAQTAFTSASSKSTVELSQLSARRMFNYG